MPGLASFGYYRGSKRGVAQPGRALRSGRRGRVFESHRPDFFWGSFTGKEVGI
jgi:hypothetical protein